MVVLPQINSSVGGALLDHMHRQYTDGHIDRHWQPGVGASHRFALFATIGTLTQQPRLLLEIRPKEAIQEGAAWLAGQGLTR